MDLLTFCLDEQTFALPIEAVKEIRGFTKISSLPQSPAEILGVVNLRGTVLPVMCLSHRLGRKLQEPTFRNVIIVIENNGTTMGMLVDKVLDIIALADEEIQTKTNGLVCETEPLLFGLALHEGEMVRILDLGHILMASKDAA